MRGKNEKFAKKLKNRKRSRIKIADSALQNSPSSWLMIMPTYGISFLCQSYCIKCLITCDPL